MIFHFLLDEVPTIAGFSVVWVAVIGAAGALATAIIAPFFTYLYMRKQNNANLGKTEAETTKTKADTVSLTIDKLIELTNKFRIAQDEYIALKDKFAIVSRDFEDFKITVHELLFIMQAVLVAEPPDSLLRKQVDKIKAEFFVVAEATPIPKVEI